MKANYIGQFVFLAAIALKQGDLVRAQDLVARSYALLREGQPWHDAGFPMTASDLVYWQAMVARVSALVRSAYDLRFSSAS